MHTFRNIVVTPFQDTTDDDGYDNDGKGSDHGDYQVRIGQELH